MCAEDSNQQHQACLRRHTLDKEEEEEEEEEESESETETETETEEDDQMRR